MSFRRSITWIVGALGAVLALSWVAFAQTGDQAKDVLERALRALRESNFTAHIVIRMPDGGQPQEVVELLLYRRPPDEIRLEPVVTRGEAGTWYILEKGQQNIQLISERKEALVLGRPRVGPIFAMVEAFLERGRGSGELAVSEVPPGKQGEKLVRIYAPDRSQPFELLVDTRDCLPRTITIRAPGGRKWMALALSKVEVVSPDYFTPEFFEVPPNWRVIGPPGPPQATEKERLRRFRRMMPGAKPGRGERPPEEPKASVSGVAGEAGKTAQAELLEDEGFLPLIPAQPPEGFSLAEVRVVFFQGDLIFHLELVNPEKRQLISIFQARGPKFFEETEDIEQPGRISIVRRLTDRGVLVLLLSSDVGEEELAAVADSLTDDPERARELVTRAIDTALGENEEAEK